jgi:hypothetical protein
LPHNRSPGPTRAPSNIQEYIMGKYFIGWLLGVPAVVLLIAYFFFG